MPSNKQLTCMLPVIGVNEHVCLTQFDVSLFFQIHTQVNFNSYKIQWLIVIIILAR